MSKSLYPAITDFSLSVILLAEPGAEITPALLDAARTKQTTFDLSAVTFEDVLADLDKAHMIDSDNRLTQLGDKFAEICRAWFARQVKA
jgi:hypothetical protein